MLKSKTVIAGIVMIALGVLDMIGRKILGFDSSILPDIGIAMTSVELMGAGVMAIFMRLGIAKS